MNDNYQTDYFLRTIKSMENTDLMLAYKNRSDYAPEFMELLLEEMSIRGYDTTEIKKSFEDNDIDVIKSKDNYELIDIYYKREKNNKEGWDILAKNELKNRGIDVELQTDEIPPMFKNCFSFKGRIRRLEHNLSFIIVCVYVFFIIPLFLDFAFSPHYDMWWLYILLLIPAFWFLFSQGVRRCHDLGFDGWFLLMPFVSWKTVFSDGDFGINKYGKNPKGQGNFVIK
jgi:hypothetical protein